VGKAKEEEKKVKVEEVEQQLIKKGTCNHKCEKCGRF